MPFDPRAGIPLDPDAALRERVRDLERQAAANPGAAAGGGFDSTVLTTGLNSNPDYVGPFVTLTIPEPGAFVQVYLELEVNHLVLTGSTWNFEAMVIDDRTWQFGGVDPDYFMGPQIVTNMPGAGITVPTGFSRARQPAKRRTDNLLANELEGVPVTHYMDPGLRRFGVWQRTNGGPNNAAQTRNRRLMVRVVQ